MTREGPSHAPPSSDPEEAAAWWDVRLRSPRCDEADRGAFDLWRQERAENAQAFDRLQTALRILRAGGATDPQLRAIRERARGVAAGRDRHWRVAAAALLAAGIFGGSTFFYRTVTEPAKPPSVYRTLAGERSTLHLADGSVVTLNSNTEVHVAFRKKRRDLALVSGEAVFKVAKDADRPFSVAAGRRQVVAVGTAFNVRVEASELRVTMIEGRVEVGPVGGEAANKRLLVAGQRLTARTDSDEIEIAKVNVAEETAWLENKIIFKNDPLARAVEEYNRYSGQMIRVGDRSLDDVPISGMFKTNEPETFLDALTSYHSLATSRTATGEIVITRK